MTQLTFDLQADSNAHSIGQPDMLFFVSKKPNSKIKVAQSFLEQLDLESRDISQLTQWLQEKVVPPTPVHKPRMVVKTVQARYGVPKRTTITVPVWLHEHLCQLMSRTELRELLGSLVAEAKSKEVCNVSGFVSDKLAKTYCLQQQCA